jgi:hypothetical protein
MKNHELQVKVTSAMYKIIRDKGVVSPVEVLIEIGALSKEDYENWRFGRISYLERVCKMNLHKLSAVMHEIRVYAKKYKLKESWSAYNKRGKSENTRLRFSKYGVEQIERSYATHYVSIGKIEEAQTQCEFQND